MNDGVGIVKTEYATLFSLPEELVLESGQKLSPITLAYETYGKLNPDKSNAILVFHALSGDAHAAGFHEGDSKPGWWDNMIGPSKALDTNKYFMICANVIGGCKGSTGPSSMNPKTQKPYGVTFPIITIADMVRAQKKLLDLLGIKKLLTVIGGSMGGMQALQWATLFPESIQSAIVIASSLKHTAQQIAFNEVARQAIMADPDWQDGDYYKREIPARGLSVARMVGHITYMSETSMEQKFGRKLVEHEEPSNDFEVASYLKYRGDSFVQRFDANSFLYITKAIDLFDLATKNEFQKSLAKSKANFLIISFSSDWLYPTHQSKDMVKILKSNDVDVSFCEIHADYGHDSFLVEIDQQSHLISHFLANIQKKG